MAVFRKVIQKSDLQAGCGKTVEIEGIPIALFNVGGNFYAIGNTCLHRGGPLGEGDLSGNVVTCPWHAWEFDVTTGCALHSPEEKVQSYEVKLEGEDVLVAV
ncbi:MAG: Rieske 2Fe-2S domain-containing protein [Elusimicrobia bacterium]|nr:Rieske 2Fe-2S domain-containing protein [Elusimicrobiota bacterium]